MAVDFGEGQGGFHLVSSRGKEGLAGWRGVGEVEEL
jgi:hypothetical protein